MSITAIDLHRHLQSVGHWVDWQNSCDGFKFGPPDTPIEGIAVAWQSHHATLQEAYHKGCNLFITHEPTFYSHMDDDVVLRQTLPARRKAALLEETGIIVYRCHDVWDRFPKIGVRDAWGEFLHLGDPIRTKGYYNLYRIPATTAWELVQSVGMRVAELGEQSVHFIGDRSQIVHKLAIGTGAITDIREMVALGADAVLATDDGTILWRDAAWASDLGIPLLIVNHMTSEIPGIKNLAIYLDEKFPSVPVHFMGPTCSYEIFVTQKQRERSIRMRRDDLENLAPLKLPTGYSCRSMRPTEISAYLKVLNQSTHSGDADLQWFKETFSSDRQYNPAYVQIIWKGEEPVAAATAWHNKLAGEQWGQVHWVGVIANERNKGLGTAVVLAALHKLRQRGFERAMLDTQDWRLPAIATYLKLGFKPWPTSEVPAREWDIILKKLKQWRSEQSDKPTN